MFWKCINHVKLYIHTQCLIVYIHTLKLHRPWNFVTRKKTSRSWLLRWIAPTLKRVVCSAWHGRMSIQGLCDFMEVHVCIQWLGSWNIACVWAQTSDMAYVYIYIYTFIYLFIYTYIYIYVVFVYTFSTSDMDKDTARTSFHLKRIFHSIADRRSMGKDRMTCEQAKECAKWGCKYAKEVKEKREVMRSLQIDRAQMDIATHPHIACELLYDSMCIVCVTRYVHSMRTLIRIYT